MNEDEKEQEIDELINQLRVMPKQDPRASLRKAILQDFKNYHIRKPLRLRMLSEIKWIFSRPRLALTGFVLAGVISGSVASALAKPRLTPEAELSALLVPPFDILELSHE